MSHDTDLGRVWIRRHAREQARAAIEGASVNMTDRDIHGMVTRQLRRLGVPLPELVALAAINDQDTSAPDGTLARRPTLDILNTGNILDGS